MPEIHITYDEQVIKTPVLSFLVEKLPAIVAEGLRCNDPGGSLIPADCEVVIHRLGPLDVSRYHLQIKIEANDYPDRRATLDNRTGWIKDKVQTELCFRDPALTGLKYFVWVRLCPGGFEQGVIYQ